MVRNQDLSRNFFVFSFFYCLNKPLSCQRNIKLLRTVIILRQTYRADIKFKNDMPPMSKKRRYAKSVMSLVGKNISNGMFRSLKASALIVIEDEIENELYTYDIWQAQLHDLSDDSTDDEDNVNNIFYNLHGSCIDDNLTGAVLEYAVEKYKSH